MPSLIDINNPTSTDPTVESVRTNFLHAKNEIEALQAQTATIATLATAVADALNQLANHETRITNLDGGGSLTPPPPPPPPPNPVITLTRQLIQNFNVGDAYPFHFTIANDGGVALNGYQVEFTASNANGALVVNGAAGQTVFENLETVGAGISVQRTVTVTIADPRAFSYSITVRGLFDATNDQSGFASATLTGSLSGSNPV